MATGMERLEKNMDKLERFFKKRKPAHFRQSSISNGRESMSTSSRHSNSIDLDLQTFPSPSFIRPTSTRMRARDEVDPTARRTRRAQSLPDSPNPSERAPSPAPTRNSYCNLLDQFPKIPQRSSSLRQVPYKRLSLRPLSGTASLAELLTYSVPEDFTMSSETLVGSFRSTFRFRRMSDPPRQADYRSNGRVDAVAAVAASQNDYTPPPSAQEEKFPLSAQIPDIIANQKDCSIQGNPTPEPSPKLTPMISSANPQNLRMAAAHLRATRPRSVDDLTDGARKITMISLRKTSSDNALSTSTSLLVGKDTLREPSLDDFMSLSDDDIADDCSSVPDDASENAFDTPILLQEPATPPSCSLPPNPPQPTTPDQQLARLSNNAVDVIPYAPSADLAVPAPLSASQPPATVAAFQAARIAARYKFDLVYVVNLWPSNTGCSHPRPGSTKSLTRALPRSTCVGHSVATPTHSLWNLQELHKCLEGQGSVANINPPDDMNGRLLAAYGLPSVLSPFRISAPVHQKILRADQWLEYRSSAPALDEFALGYSCAFYTGYTPDGKWRPVETEANRTRTGSPEQRPHKRPEKPLNRGIVFAAYRLPNADGSVLATDKDELNKLHMDAEIFVEALIDIHMMQQQKDVPAEIQAPCPPSDSNSTIRCAPRDDGTVHEVQEDPLAPLLTA